MNRSAVTRVINAAFSDPNLRKRGGLNIELHIGRRQAQALGDVRKWPIRLQGQDCYLVDEDDCLRAAPRGSFKKGDAHAR